MCLELDTNKNSGIFRTAVSAAALLSVPPHCCQRCLTAVSTAALLTVPPHC